MIIPPFEDSPRWWQPFALVWTKRTSVGSDVQAELQVLTKQLGKTAFTTFAAFQAMLRDLPAWLTTMQDLIARSVAINPVAAKVFEYIPLAMQMRPDVRPQYLAVKAQLGAHLETQKAALIAERKREDEEAAEELARRRAAEAEATRVYQEAQRRAAEEEEARLKRVADDQEAQRRAADEEAARLKRVADEDEEARRRAAGKALAEEQARATPQAVQVTETKAVQDQSAAQALFRAQVLAAVDSLDDAHRVKQALAELSRFTPDLGDRSTLAVAALLSQSQPDLSLIGDIQSAPHPDQYRDLRTRMQTTAAAALDLDALLTLYPLLCSSVVA